MGSLYLLKFIGATEGFYQYSFYNSEDAPQEEVASGKYKLVFVNDELQIIPIIYYKYKDIEYTP